MRLRKIIVKDFKRFTHLTVKGIPREARLIMIAGDNGTGKSSFFEALNTWHLITCGKNGRWDPSYHTKASSEHPGQWTGQDIYVNFHEVMPNEVRERKKLFYFRSAYRNEPETHIQILRLDSGDVVDHPGVMRMIDNDATISQNYQRLVGQGLKAAFETEEPKVTMAQFRENQLGDIRRPFKRLFPQLEIDSLGDPISDGTFRFTRGKSRGYSIQNLSGGEKATFDLILDLVVKSRSYDNTVFFIDEPDAHMSTRHHATLLSELYDLIPDNCQLVMATHSIGMMRRAQDLAQRSPGSVVFLDFDMRDFDSPQIIEPIVPDRHFWSRTYGNAAHDIADLIAPKRVVICEGSPKTSRPSKNHSNDARCYNQMFETEHTDTRFVSAGNAGEVASDHLGLGEALRLLVGGIEIIRLIDRDDQSEQEVLDLRGKGVRVLSRRNLESYLFDDEVLRKLAASVGKEDKSDDLIKEAARLRAGKDGSPDDLKRARGEIYLACKKILRLTQCGNTKEAFMRDTLALLITSDMTVYRELHTDIFGGGEAARLVA